VLTIFKMELMELQDGFGTRYTPVRTGLLTAAYAWKLASIMNAKLTPIEEGEIGFVVTKANDHTAYVQNPSRYIETELPF
jgi:hypothetical protein